MTGEIVGRKGTTLARGEEARVVVNQPRGVGLMHTQPLPSVPNYTHGERDRCKRSGEPKTVNLL